MPKRLSPGSIVPSAVFGLGIGDQSEGPIQHLVQTAIARRGHAMGLSQHEGRQPVVVHVALLVGHVQQSGRFGVVHHVVQRPLDGTTVPPPSGPVAGCHERQSAQADQAQIIRTPVPLGSLVAFEPIQTTFERLVAFERDFPFALGHRVPRRYRQADNQPNNDRAFH